MAIASEEDVSQIARRLEQLASEEAVDAVAALECLKSMKDCQMTVSILQKTRIGHVVNTLRKKTSDQECAKQARHLIKVWKNLLPPTTDGHDGGEETSAASPNGNGAADGDEPSAKMAKITTGASKNGKGHKEQPNIVAENDSVRQRCEQLIFDALTAGMAAFQSSGGVYDMEKADLKRLAQELEGAIFADIHRTDEKYKARIRSRIANLKDKKNTDLCISYVCGAIKADELARMPSEKMASAHLKNLRAKFIEESINESQMTFTGGTTTSDLKCGRCGKSSCTYNQVQTRSADEPMTTFVLCNECGHRWKFC